VTAAPDPATPPGVPTTASAPDTAGPARPGLAGLFGPASVGRYGLIGLTGVTLDTVLFLVLVQTGTPPVPATVLSTLAGILNNYVLNAKLNFGTSLNLVQGRRFVTVGLLGLLVAALSLQALISLGLSELVAKLVSVPVVVVSQFVANKRWSFRDGA
jgi:putative flippase GtrA